MVGESSPTQLLIPLYSVWAPTGPQYEAGPSLAAEWLSVALGLGFLHFPESEKHSGHRVGQIWGQVSAPTTTHCPSGPFWSSVSSTVR